MAEVTVAIFAKAPVLGRVKTRMQPRLSAEQALELHCNLVRHTLDNCVSSGFNTELWCSEAHPWLQAQAEEFNVAVREQVGADLGQRMAHATKCILDAGTKPILVGADCPQVNSDVLKSAAKALLASDLVMTPATDGGYVLVGLSRQCDAIFNGPEWGTSHVAEQTRLAARLAGFSLTELEVLSDIDRPEDLALARELGLW